MQLSNDIKEFIYLIISGSIYCYTMVSIKELRINLDPFLTLSLDPVTNWTYALQVITLFGDQITTDIVSGLHSSTIPSNTLFLFALNLSDIVVSVIEYLEPIKDLVRVYIEKE